MAGTPLVQGPHRPADVLLSDVHVLDPRAMIDTRRTCVCAGGVISELGAPATLEVDGVQE